MRRVAYRKSAAKALRKLPPEVQEQIIAALRRYAEKGEGDVRKLVGRDGARLRSGDYRAIFLETEGEIEVTHVGHRKAIYR